MINRAGELGEARLQHNLMRSESWLKIARFAVQYASDLSQTEAELAKFDDLLGARKVGVTVCAPSDSRSFWQQKAAVFVKT
ncbi:MAG TPA: hypothetical protein PLN33_03165 [Hyphomonadaceae bacterium]|nr:hypothetical protein [Hyphomonadaceae bacterium]HPN06671.1 hypothetical protein [Hyphomonadaceae bacterium]